MISFEQRADVGARSPHRADVALFVGAVARRPGTRVDPLHARARQSDPLYRWLEAQGWTLAQNRRDGAALEELLDVPVPIESFADFERLFSWDRRVLEGSRTGASYLGLAVRAFFEEGGRRCYVVRVCDPWPAGQPGDAASLLIPREAGRPTGSAVDRSTWRGLWHLYGLPDVSFVCVPDLPDACAPPPPPPRPLPEPVVTVEGFVECAAPLPAPPAPPFARAFAAPRCDDAGYLRWAQSVRIAVEGIERAEPTSTLRETQLVAAVPLPLADQARGADSDLLGYLRDELGLDLAPPSGLSSAFLQLVYPWVRVAGAAQPPEGLASPDGTLAGVLAQNALARGTFHSVAGTRLRSVIALEPALRRDDTSLRSELAGTSSVVATAALDEAEQLAVTPEARGGAPARLLENLVRRASLFGPSPAGLVVLSDVSTSRDPIQRQAHVRRLLASVIRAAREVGESNVFESSGPVLWSRVRDQMTRVLRALYQAGALGGASEPEAFSVRCDRSTMSQSDLDRGRLVVELELLPASAIDRIVVSFSVQDGSLSTRAA